ncbi:MAG: hypothetical protein J3Q66DRAFT_443809 [Benniella sp.]|nr:MAG: hypothetical protein J3Q66DRAFT_443809 [Benniella sp.]
MASTNINPLDIPEIRSMVGQYLDQSDLARCSRVCKSWHAAFVPLVWSTAMVSDCSYDDNPPLKAFIRHSHHLKDLSFDIDAQHEYRFTSCPNLLRLRVDAIRYTDDEDIDIVLVQIALYEKLRYLSIYGVVMGPLQRIIWAPIHYRNLSELELHDLEIEPMGTATFWHLRTQLVSLKIEKVTVTGLPDRSITFDRLQRLRLWLKSQNLIGYQLEWIIRCPNLTSLNWCYSSEGQLTSWFMGRFVPGTWPQLSELVLVGIELTDAQLAQVIGAMQNLKSLRIQECEVGSRFLEALRRHSQTLISLNTTHCEVLTQSLVPEILASFPHLESLYVERVMVQEIIDGLPWVCEHSLKVLRIGISFPCNQDTDYQRQVFQRISRLTNLKLTLDCGRGIDKSLHLSLDNGLDQLATLKQLEKLSLLFRPEPLSVRDAEWMINNWKNLKKVEGYFSYDMELLESMFSAAGIKFGVF